MSDDFIPSETLTIEGSEALKSLGDENGKARVGAYAIRFAGPEEKDLTGDYFTAKTDFGPRDGNGVTTMVNHGIPLSKDVAELKAVAGMTFGPVTTRRDEVGIFVETCLDTANQYEKAIADLCAQGKLRWSSGTSPHIAVKTADGEITRWHPIEFSFTPKAAEPRLPAIRALKSLEGDAPSEISDAFTKAVPVVDTPKAPTPEKPRITIMELTPDQKAAQDKAIADGIKSRTAEIAEIHAIADRFNCRDKAGEFIVAGKSLNEFRDFVLKDVVKAAPVVNTPVLGMSRSDVKEWSFLKAIREAHMGKLSGIELEASQATAGAIKKTPNGFFIPHDVLVSSMAESNDLGVKSVRALTRAIKTLNQTTYGSGGALVGTNLLTGSMIELLRNKPLVAQMGAMTLSGLVGNIAIPRITGGATAYWLNEQGQVTGTDQSFDQLGLVPKRLIGRTGYTKELMNQTDLSVEALVRNDLTTVLAIAKDLAAINGAGGSEPLGIMNQPTGLNSVTFSGAASRAKLIEFQAAVAADNASRGALAYLTTPASAAKQMNIPETQYSTKFIWDGNIDQGTVVGRPAYSTNQVPGDKVIYGNWNDLILADWAGIDVVVNPYTNDATGVVTITITLWTDCGVRHVVSFAVSTDTGAA